MNRGKRDLRLQLLILYLLFVALVFSLTLLFYINAGQRLRVDVAAADLSLARAIALETDTSLLNLKETAQTFAEMPAIKQIDLAEMDRIFSTGLATRSDLSGFHRLSADGQIQYSLTDRTAPLQIVRGTRPPPYVEAARRTQEPFYVTTGVTTDITEASQQPQVTAIAPVFVQGRFDGVIAVDLTLLSLAETVKRIGLKQPTKREVEIVMVDSSGRIIVHSVIAPLPSIDDLPQLTEVLSGREGSQVTTDRWNVEWLYTYTPLPVAGWGVLVQNPAKQAFASLENIQRGLLLALTLFSLAAFLCWRLISRRIITPLEQLTRYAEGVGQPSPDAALNREGILPLSTKPDQIGRLTRALLTAEQTIRGRFAELTILNKTSAAVAASLNTEQVINTILDAVQRLLGVRQCAVMVMNAETNYLEMKAGRGLSQGYLTSLNLIDGARKLPAYRAIESGQLLQVPDIEADERLTPLLPLIRAEGYRSALIIPLITLHVPPAVLTIYHPDVHHFTDQEIDLAASFANHAALALEQATLFSLTDAELQKQVQFLSALNRVAKTVSQSLVMDEVLRNAQAAILDVMQGDACWIYLQREGESFFRFRSQQGLNPALATQLATHCLQPGDQPGAGPQRQVAATGRPLTLDVTQIAQLSLDDDPIITAEPWQAVTIAPLVAKGITIGTLSIAGYTTRRLIDTEAELLAAIGNQLVIAVMNARLYRRSRSAAILEERNRVAREIHDTLAQGFTGILIQLQAAERLSLKYPDQARVSLQEAQDLARQSLQEARRSVLNLRPTILEHIPLDRALDQQVTRFGEAHHLKANFALQGYPSPLNPDVEQNLYRIAQEALTNVSRHAQAKRVDVCLNFSSRTVTLTITDDGIGLNGHHPAAGRNGSTGFGLVGIQERVALMHGQADFVTVQPGGTRIKVVIPK